MIIFCHGLDKWGIYIEVEISFLLTKGCGNAIPVRNEGFYSVFFQ